MNEALAEACLRVARLTHDLAEARAEVAELKSQMEADKRRGDGRVGDVPTPTHP